MREQRFFLSNDNHWLATTRGQIILNKASIQSLTLQTTFIEGMDATSLSVKQNLWFSDGLQANRTVWLRNVAIDGMMLCDGAHFHRTPWDGKSNDLPHGLNLESAKIKGNLSLKNICSV